MDSDTPQAVPVARRIAAGTALALILGLVAIVLLAGGSGYHVIARLENASQLVKGDLVQVAGQPVGGVEEIRLTDDGQAELRLSIDGDFAPLRRGTLPVVRQPSLSGVANRYVELRQGPMGGEEIPDGGLLPAQDIQSAVDLDQLFDTFDPGTRAAAREVLEGFADSAEGRTAQANAAIRYLNPLLSASERLFGELDRNDDLLERFVVESSRLVTDVADKRERLAGLVDHFATVSTALASRDAELADAVARLPGFLRKANTTFVNLRATLDDLDPLVRESRPVVRALRPLLGDLRPFARDAAPALRDLRRSIRTPGTGNDLVELLRAQPAVDRIANRTVQANGAARRGALPELREALTESTPQLAFGRPYAVDLVGWFDDFSASGAYDALGSFSRAGLAFSAFTFTPALNVVPVPPELRDDVLAAGAKVGRNNRCPGSNERDPGDGSTPWRPTAAFDCDPEIRPIGP